MMDITKVRHAFPHTDGLVYMNHAALSPIGSHVRAAIDALVEERHLTNIENYFDFLPVIDSVKDKAAAVLHTEASQVEFVPNTSAGLNILAHGLAWEAGDEILIPGCEFPANVYPFMQLQSKGVQVRFIPHHEGTFTLEDVAACITPKTRLLSVSWVQFLSGFKADLDTLGRLCKAHDVLFCVDAIQGLGALEINVESSHIDFLATGGHKWLMAMQGIGLVYAAQPLLEQLRPRAGWLHGPIDWEHLIDYELSFYDDARRFRLGTQNATGIAALDAALGFYLDAGPAWCEAQVLHHMRLLQHGLKTLGFTLYGESSAQHHAGIVAARHPDADTVYEALKQLGIHIAVRNGLLRFSPTYYNTSAEVEQVLRALEKLLAQYPV
ncbi:MAG: aminotransferase class V-fold PLP-dependent enzyme [Bacteroidota bacterium]